MKKIILNPFIAPILTCIFLLYINVFSQWLYSATPLDFFGNESEVLTYTFYGIGLITALIFFRDFWKTDKQTTYFALLFLWLIALLREMGAQHWLTKHDTTAIKIRFFTNPNNPLHEKVVAGALVILVVGIALWLLIKYLKPMIKGFFSFKALYWTIATFGGVGMVSQFCDRFPSNYYKATGERLNNTILEGLKLFEEGGEICLPLLFALAFVQYHIMKQGQRRHIFGKK